MQGSTNRSNSSSLVTFSHSKIFALICALVSPMSLIDRTSGNIFISDMIASKSAFLCMNTSTVCSTSCLQYLTVSWSSSSVSFLGISNGMDDSFTMFPRLPSKNFSPLSIFAWNTSYDSNGIDLNRFENVQPAFSLIIMWLLISFGFMSQRIPFRM